ncbi:cell division transport system permease protein [Rhodobacter viridis]|uniref:Cell division transport system permease protein n=1 Tax=Rhodobacter viridis TaxID=1054202 RepID=A0A318TZL9_9RHOB|nr:cell division protein FtsX [Rhodobacter viridis]PYF09310.1 cell division transport system permease protein [Rhodobacter viridis]
MRFNPFSSDLSTADRVVPPTGFTANLTVLTSAAMAFLAVFALALSMASGRLADRWSEALARSATIRISAPADQMETQLRAVLDALATTPGVASYRPMDEGEMRKLLDPWFGPDLPVDTLPLPKLVELTETDQGIDAEGLRLRLAAEAPGAVLDDHTRWRKPLIAAAGRLRLLGWLSLVLIGGAMAGMITLAAQAALAANGQVIRTLRLVGAQDAFIAGAFVRRFTKRGLAGAGIGTALGMAAVAALPAPDVAGGFLTGLGFTGWGWLWPLALPVLAAVVAYGATRAAALRMLRGIR